MIPKVKGINQKKVVIVSFIIIFTLIILVFAGFMGVLNRDNSSTTLGLNKDNRSQINPEGDNLERVAQDWSSKPSGLPTQTANNASDVTSSNKKEDKSAYTPTQSSDEVPPIDDFQKQIIEVRQTNDLNKLKRHYAAYNSRTMVYARAAPEANSSAKSDSSSGSAEGGSGSNADGQSSTSKTATNATGDGVKTLEAQYKLGGNNSLIATTVIPAVLISTLVSDNSGPVSAQVSNDVYDSKTGYQLLIPRGSKMIGFYNGRIAYGSTRIDVAFRQLCFPNGQCIDLAQEPGTDPQGSIGLHDQVDNHYWQLFGLNFIGSVIKNGASYAQSSAASGTGLQPSAGGVTQDMGQTTNQVIDSKIQTSPTITIRGGSIIRIMLTNNMILKPYNEEE